MSAACSLENCFMRLLQSLSSPLRFLKSLSPDASPPSPRTPDTHPIAWLLMRCLAWRRGTSIQMCIKDHRFVWRRPHSINWRTGRYLINSAQHRGSSFYVNKVRAEDRIYSDFPVCDTKLVRAAFSLFLSPRVNRSIKCNYTEGCV